jgi:hypothetical protein
LWASGFWPPHSWQIVSASKPAVFGWKQAVGAAAGILLVIAGALSVRR